MGPFCSKRSTMGAALIEVALDAIDAGIIQRPSWTRAETGNKVTEVSERAVA